MNVSTIRLESGQIVRGPNSCGTDGLRQRFELLDQRDRLLVELATSAAASHRRIGELVGVGPGTVSRRLRRISARVHDPLVARLLDERCPLGPEYRQIGVEHFLAAKTLARIAREHETTVAAVRATIAYVRTWHRLTRPGGRAA